MASSLLLRETVAGAALPSFPPGQQMASSELCTKAPGHIARSFFVRGINTKGGGTSV